MAFALSRTEYFKNYSIILDQRYRYNVSSLQTDGTDAGHT